MNLFTGILLGILLAYCECNYLNVITHKNQIEVLCESGVRITYSNINMGNLSINNSMSRLTINDYSLDEATVIFGNCGVIKK